MRIRTEEASRAREEAEKRQQKADVLKRLPRLEKGEDLGYFLEGFEHALMMADIPEDTWGRHLAGVLTGKAKEAHASSVPLESRENYKLTKSILLDMLSRPTGSYVAECFHWSKPFKATPGEVVAKVKISLSRAFSQYGDVPFAAIVLTTLSAYSQECINTVLGKKPENVHDLVKAISDFEATHGSYKINCRK